MARRDGAAAGCYGPGMVAVLSQVLPFFALVGLGWAAGITGFFSREATAALTRFVFYFALSAMIFGFVVSLPMAALWDPRFVMAYLAGSFCVYLLALAAALARGTGAPVAAMEAQCAVVGNVGFLGIPMLVLLLGEAAAGPVMLILATDLVVFGSLVVIAVTGARDGRVSPKVLLSVGRGLLANPMIVSMVMGLAVSAAEVPIPGPVQSFLATLGAAATPGALFAIGCTLAHLPAERPAPAAWLTALKLGLHPLAVAVAAAWLEVDPYAAGVMVAAAALPVAGNVYILASHYGVAAGRVSASILFSTVLAVATVPPWIAWIGG